MSGPGEQAVAVPDAPRRIARSRPPRTRGRIASIAAVAAVVVGAGVAGAADPPPSAPPPPPTGNATGVAPPGARSSSAFCAGGTVGAGGAATSTVYLTNTTLRPVTGVMTAVSQPASGPAPAAVRRGVTVPAASVVAVDPGAGLPAGGSAVSFSFAGGGVAANQSVAGPSGWSTAPCAAHASPSWYFAGGSTAPGAALSLALSNPGAAAAQVNLTFLTDGGVVAPAPFQGLTVPPGGLVVEDVGAYVQDHATIATVVSAQSGTVVADELQQWTAAPAGGLSLRLGSPAPSTTWQFAQTTDMAGATVAFDLANPGATATTATVSVGAAMATVVPIEVPLPPRSVTTFSASGTARLPRQTTYAVTVTAPAPIVVGRTVQAAAGSPAPVTGLTSGTVATSTAWLVASPGTAAAPPVAGATLVSLAVSNPGPVAARVAVSPVASGRPAATVTVAAHSLTVLGSDVVGDLGTYVVRSDRPVAVEADAGPAGAPGIVAWPGVGLAG